jgi:hypothetical protein
MPAGEPVEDVDGLAEAVAEQLLDRWGIVFRDVVARENLALPWREIVWALRRLEARGSIRGGRFVSGFTGEQFALPEALETLARVRRRKRSGERVEVCGSDPLNLVGILTPGARIPSRSRERVVFVDGRPASLEGTESARVASDTPRVASDTRGVASDTPRDETTAGERVNASGRTSEKGRADPETGRAARRRRKGASGPPKPPIQPSQLELS